MPDPVVEAQSQAFASGYLSLEDPADRDTARNGFIDALLKQGDSITTYETLLRTGELINEDLTTLAQKPPVIRPLSPEAARQAVDEAKQGVPWYRRAIARTAAGAEWFQTHVTEPTVAVSLATASGLIPGEQPLDTRIAEARRRIAAERTVPGQASALSDFIQASTDAYRQTSLPWGVKGTLELAIDPLNLIGLGIPGKAMKSFPSIAKIIFPLHAIDRAPDYAVRKILSAGSDGAKRITGLNKLFSPHISSQVKQTGASVWGRLSGEFTQEQLLSGTPLDTARVLGDNFNIHPNNSDPFSPRNIMNHMAEEFKDADSYEKWIKSIQEMEPAKAVLSLQGFAEDLERKALARGGTTFVGDVVEGDLRQRRRGSISGILQKLQIDENIALGMAEAIDDQIYLYWDTIWLKRIEPTVIRPWAIANLAFSGFFVMNVVEDVAMATLGMGGLGRKGFSDEAFIGIVGGLDGVPSDILRAGRDQQIFLDSGPGFFKSKGAEKKTIHGVAGDVIKYPVTLSSTIGAGIRRSAWVNKYFKEFDAVLMEKGFNTQELSGIRDFLHGELPEGLEHLREEIGGKVWAAVTTGNPEDIRQLHTAFTSESILRKAQFDIVMKNPDMSTDLRRTFQKVLSKRSITPDNMTDIMNEAREELMDWHKFSSEAVRDQFQTLSRNLETRPVKSAAEATGLLASFQTAMDEVTQLPREIQAHARIRAKQVPFADRQAILDESLEVITVELKAAREEIQGAIKKSRPEIERHLLAMAPDATARESLSQSIDTLFEGYQEISDKLQDTWINYRKAKDAHFQQTPDASERGDGFWKRLDDIGEEAWDLEYEGRVLAANKIRAGWNHIIDSMGTGLSTHDNTLLKNNLDAMINDAKDKMNKSSVKINDKQLRFDTLPDALREGAQEQITNLKDGLLVTKSQHDALVARLERFVTIQPNQHAPATLIDYDRQISLQAKVIDKAREAGSLSQIPGDEELLKELLVDREKEFQRLIPEVNRSEWNRLQKERVDFERLGSPEQQAANESDMKRFRNKIETGESETEVIRVRSDNTNTVHRTADWLLMRNAETPISNIDSMKAILSDAALQGDESAVAFREALDKPPTNLAAEDILAKVHGEPKAFGRLSFATGSKTQDIFERTVKNHGSTTRIDGTDMLEAVQSDPNLPRYSVSGYPDQEVTIPFSEFKVEDIQAFAEENKALLRQENHYLGTWYDIEDTKLVYLDVVTPQDTLGEAGRLGKLNKEIAVYNMETGDTVLIDDIAEPFVSNEDQVHEELYSVFVTKNREASLDPLHRDMLARVQHGDLFPTETLDDLVEAGFIEPLKPLKNGRVRTSITRQGQSVLDIKNQAFDVEHVLDDLPPPVREQDTLIDEKMAQLETMSDEMLKLWENPPLRGEQEAVVRGYLNSMADYMDHQSNFNGIVKEARQEASTRATTSYNTWFTNYDNRSTFDYIMQRFMPFWMYESRRWPRLATLAAKRPIVAKHLALVGGDWDYGYTPTVYGNEFNPLKGTGAGAVRRTLARDFPEYNTGYRGKVEQGLDWFARGAFYFNPLITSTANILQGEAGAIPPPPLSLALNAWVATGAELPPGLHNLAFDSRYTQYLIDQVIADNLKKNPQEVRRLAEAGNEDAIAELVMAEREAAIRQIFLTQTSVFRYRPDAKVDFGESMEEAIERIVGIPQDMLKELRRLGISYTEIVAVSGAQRQAIMDAVPESDVWLGASLSLKPLAEQKAQRSQGGFWQTIETTREANRLDHQKNSSRWEDGFTSGPEALNERSSLDRERGAIFNAIHAMPEFVDVPVSMEERQAYLARFGKPAPMISPIDEALEQYFQITADLFLDQRTGETNWGAYFDARKQLMDTFTEPIRSILQSELRRSETVLDRTLELYTPKLREYYGVRSAVMDQLEAANPEIASVASEYRRLMNFAQKASTEADTKYFSDQARSLLSINPDLSMAETIIRRTRKKLREDDRHMERAYQLFIAPPKSIPRQGATPKSVPPGGSPLFSPDSPVTNPFGGGTLK